MSKNNEPAGRPAAPDALSIESLSFSYNGAAVLQDINIKVKQGEFLALLGPSGSGKTTLLRLVAGMEYPARGRILCNGKVVDRPGADRGMVFQDYSLFPWISLRENIVLAINCASPKLPRAEKVNLAEEYLRLVGLAGSSRKYPFELSGGMQQRGAIARALALGSPFLLMDEPFGALDPVTRIRLQDLLIDIWINSSPPRTVVFVTHDIDEALYLSDRTIILGSSPGRVIAGMDLPFPRPRPRQHYLKNARYREIRDEIIEYFRRDALEQLESIDSVKSSGEGI